MPDPAGSGSKVVSDTGTRVAVVSVSSASANGPDPTGCVPNGWSARTSTGTSARMWAGAIGWVAACRNPPSGVVRVKVTVRSLMARTATSVHDPAAGPV